MSIKRQNRFYSQQRLSVPALRGIENAVAADFDSVLRDFVGGTTTGYILKGFKLNIGVSTFAQSADNLTVDTLNAAILNPLAIESGTLLKIDGSSSEALNTSNARVSGSFIAGSTNYISINFIRKADTSTDTVYFYDKDSETEFSKLLPVDTVLDYEIVINTTGFGSNVPVAIVTTSSGNVPTQITDSRNMFFRLGTGGLTPNQFYSFPWSTGRTEPGNTTTNSGSDPFDGADKDIGLLKDWMNAVMTSIKEVKGTSYWFSTGSGGSSSDLSLLTVNDDANLSTWTGAGNLIHDIAATGTLISDDNIFIRNMVTDSTFAVQSFTKSIVDGGVLYLDLNRYVDISGTVTIAPTGTLPGALVGQNNLVVQAGSVGQLSSLTKGSIYGDWLKSKNDNARYFRQVSEFYDAAGSVTSSVNATYALLDAAYTINGSSTGTQEIHYNQGFYPTSSVISTTKVEVLASSDLQNVYWLAYRNGANLHIRNRGRMVTGETRPVDENTSTNVLNFIGSSNESLTFPVYATTVSGGITSPSQVNYSGTTSDNLTVRVSELSSAMANKAQDKNISMIGGGNVDNSAGQMTWNASITIVVNGPGSGHVNYIAAGTANMSASYSCAYVTLDRNAVSSLPVSVTIFQNLPLSENVYVIARRLANADIYTGIDGQAYLISDGTGSTTGVNPSSPLSLGVANLHKWKQEIPTGAVNSSNTSFTLSGTPHSVTSVLVFKNGMFQIATDYSITNSNNIIFTTAPTTGDEVVAAWARGNTVPYVYVQSLTTVSATTTAILYTPSPAPSNTLSVAVFVNGLQRSQNTDFTATTSGVNFAFDLEPGTTVGCFYTGVNDNEFALQGAFNESATSGRTIYTWFSDYNHPNAAVVSFDGVAMFPINNTYGLTNSAITVNDYRWLDSQTIEAGTASITTGTVMYIWAR